MWKRKRCMPYSRTYTLHQFWFRAIPLRGRTYGPDEISEEKARASAPDRGLPVEIRLLLQAPCEQTHDDWEPDDGDHVPWRDGEDLDV